MSKKLPFVLVFFSVCFLAASCLSGSNDLATSKGNRPMVIVTRADALDGKIDVYVDGKVVGQINPGGKLGYAVGIGRHSISVSYEKKRSTVIDFYIGYEPQNFKAMVFRNTAPALEPF